MIRRQEFYRKDKEKTKELIDRAKKAGLKAIVVSCDVPAIGSRYGFAPGTWAPIGKN